MIESTINVSKFIQPNVIWFFIDIKSFRSHFGRGVDSTSNRNEYQDYLLDVKRPVRNAHNLTPCCAVVTKSGNRNFLEPSSPIRASNGTALPLTLHILKVQCLWLSGLRDVLCATALCK